MNRTSLILIALLGLAGLALQPAAAADAETFQVSIDTTPIQGFPGFLALDFTDGDGDNNNQVSVSGFSTDGALGTLSVSGDVSGDLAGGTLVLGDGEFFNSVLTSVVYGTTIEFELAVTPHGPGAGIPDSFSLFVLNENRAPAPSNDPTGADALLVIDLTGPEPESQVFLSQFATVSLNGQFEILDLNADPASLWPPNGRMVAVEIGVVTPSGAPLESACTISGVESSEPPAGDDFEITGPLTVELRARRLGSGNGRIYTVAVTCSGADGQDTATVEVRVPHDQGS